MAWFKPDIAARKAIPVLIAASAAMAPATASAQATLAATGPLALAANLDAPCRVVSATAPKPGTIPASLTKSAAILGGEMSALERMKAQQAAASAPAPAVAAPAITPMVPAASPFRPLRVDCGAQPMSASYRTFAATTVVPKPVTSRPGDFLASKRLRIGRTGFDRQWSRVARERVAPIATPAYSGSRRDLIAAVNRWVNKRVSYVEDRELYGRADYWAGAKRTLRLGKGDCEDYALTKMQILAAMGIDRKDMFLTIARDTVRNADHALLVVRTGDRFVVLDNATDKLLDGARSHDYSPVLSFNSENAWLHGF